jgi:ketosteroid isomerase-like protein
MSTATMQLARRPEDVPASLLERFNSGDPNAMMGLYEDGAVFVTDSGRPVTDPNEIRSELERFLALKLPMTANARHMYVKDDIVLFVLDWSLDGIGPDGQHVHLEGSATDVAHRGDDGRWRYVIDNPFGTAVRAE